MADIVCRDGRQLRHSQVRQVYYLRSDTYIRNATTVIHMGLNIHGSYVEVDLNHNRLLNSSSSSNPTSKTIDGLKIFGVFQRLKSSKNSSHPPVGDNAHLLYALKKKDGLTTGIKEIKKLLPDFYNIITSIGAASDGFDLIVPMPSSHNISKTLCRVLSKKLGIEAIADVFLKITIADAEALLLAAPLKYADRKRIGYRLSHVKKNTTVFSLKDIPVDYRPHFPPLIINPNFALAEPPVKILLVDDLFATGTTLLKARQLLLLAFPNAIIEAVCLFSWV